MKVISIVRKTIVVDERVDRFIRMLCDFFTRVMRGYYPVSYSRVVNALIAHLISGVKKDKAVEFIDDPRAISRAIEQAIREPVKDEHHTFGSFPQLRLLNPARDTLDMLLGIEHLGDEDLYRSSYDALVDEICTFFPELKGVAKYSGQIIGESRPRQKDRVVNSTIARFARLPSSLNYGTDSYIFWRVSLICIYQG